ncbi:Tn3 family transposase [Streptomyces sp. NPDC087859]|uniref:Tn3 family transposase n=1 Tax=Streptomyces sp. NPDC087859 TaxID=3365812 RepID=UPI0037FF6175
MPWARLGIWPRESCRRRIARRLNKGENLHALRREFAYVGEGADPAPALRAVTERMWCLTLATTAIVTWTTEYYGLAVTALRRAGRPVDDDLLPHIWPRRRANVTLYGTQAGLFGPAERSGGSGRGPYAGERGGAGCGGFQVGRRMACTAVS